MRMVYGKWASIMVLNYMVPWNNVIPVLWEDSAENVRKVAVDQSTVPGERLMVDISSVNVPSFGGAKFWVLVMDNCTGMCCSFFVAAKSKMPDQVIILIKKLQSKQCFRLKHIVKTVRCDDAGENKMLK
jgi:hypothetical protein